MRSIYIEKISLTNWKLSEWETNTHLILMFTLCFVEKGCFFNEMLKNSKSEFPREENYLMFLIKLISVFPLELFLLSVYLVLLPFASTLFIFYFLIVMFLLTLLFVFYLQSSFLIGWRVQCPQFHHKSILHSQQPPQLFLTSYRLHGNRLCSRGSGTVQSTKHFVINNSSLFSTSFLHCFHITEIVGSSSH